MLSSTSSPLSSSSYLSSSSSKSASLSLSLSSSFSKKDSSGQGTGASSLLSSSSTTTTTTKTASPNATTTGNQKRQTSNDGKATFLHLLEQIEALEDILKIDPTKKQSQPSRTNSNNDSNTVVTDHDDNESQSKDGYDYENDDDESEYEYNEEDDDDDEDDEENRTQMVIKEKPDDYKHDTVRLLSHVESTLNDFETKFFGQPTHENQPQQQDVSGKDDSTITSLISVDTTRQSDEHGGLNTKNAENSKQDQIEEEALAILRAALGDLEPALGEQLDPNICIYLTRLLNRHENIFRAEAYDIDEWMKAFQKAMEAEANFSGDPKKQYLVGRMYETGKGVQRDMIKAIKWYQRAAQHGHTRAQTELAIWHQRGQSVSQDFIDAFEWQQLAANRGHGDLETYLQNMPDIVVKAMEWVRMAVEQGCAEAQYNLGCMYGGKGMQHDDTKAIKWYTLAANQGHIQAQYELGDMYAKGQGGVANTYEMAIEWLERAANQGHLQSQIRLGNWRGSGRVVARKWLEMAANQGHLPSQIRLGHLHHDGNFGVSVTNYERDMKWCEMAAIQGHVQSQTRRRHVLHQIFA